MIGEHEHRATGDTGTNLKRSQRQLPRDEQPIADAVCAACHFTRLWACAGFTAAALTGSVTCSKRDSMHRSEAPQRRMRPLQPNEVICQLLGEFQMLLDFNVQMFRTVPVSEALSGQTPGNLATRLS